MVPPADERPILNGDARHNGLLNDQSLNGRLGQYGIRFVLVAMLIGIAAWIGAQSSDANAHVSSIWIANALAVTLIVRKAGSALDDWIVLVATFGAIAAVNFSRGDVPVTAIGIALVNMCEIWAVSALMRRYKVDEFKTFRSLAHLVAISAGVFCIGALSATAIIQLSSPGAHFASMALIWFLSDLIGMILIVPPLLSINRQDLDYFDTPRKVAGGAAFLAMLFAITFGIFLQDRYPILFLIPPLLTTSVFMARFTGSAITLFTTAAVAGTMTLMGHGPIAAYLDQPLERSLFLQFFFLITSLSSIPVSIIVTERARLHDALQTSELRFRRLAMASPAGLFHTGANGDVTYINRQFTDVTGLTLEQLQEAGLFYVVASRSMDAAIAGWKQARSAGQNFHAEYQIRQWDGSARWMSISAAPERRGDGTVSGWVGLLIDIDDSRRAAAQLAHSEWQYRLLAENSSDMIVRIGLDGGWRYVSPACERILGYAPELLLGEQHVEITPAEDRSRIEATQTLLLEGAVDPVCAYRQRHRNGGLIWLEATYRLVRHPSTGVAEEIVASIRDINGRREAEIAAAQTAALLEERNRLLNMAEQLAHMGHWRIDLVANSLFWSAEVYRIHGLPATYQPDLESAINAYHPDDRAMVERDVQAAIADGTPFLFQARIVRPDGEHRVVVSRGQAERSRGGKLVGVVGMFHDITDQSRTNEQLVAARDEMRRALDAKSDFVATMSHEIRTPLTGVLGMMELLKTTSDENDRNHYLSTLGNSAHLLLAIVDDVLDFAKFEQGKFTFESRPTEIYGLLREIASLHQAAARAKGLTIDMSGLAGSAMLLCDPTRVQQILSNFLSNAIKFTSSGHIAVRCRDLHDTQGPMWLLEVEDSGIGVDVENSACLFEPFVQQDSSTTRQFGGTGLGLAICRRLASAMGGTIGVTRNRESGATFWVRLPLLRVDDALVAPVGPLENPVPVRPLDILLAEDNAVNRLLISALMQRAGHRVMCVHDGLEAVAAVRDGGPFDIILMDMQMPRMDGIAAIRAIRALPGVQTPPIVAVTADAAQERSPLYNDLDLSAFLTKPIAPDTLLACVARLAGQPDSVSGPTDDPRMVCEPDSALDADRLRILEHSVGRHDLAVLLRLFVRDARMRPGVIRQLANADQMEAIVGEAHAFRGGASQVGARQLTQAIAEIEVEARCNALQSATLDALDDAAARAAHAALRLLDA